MGANYPQFAKKKNGNDVGAALSRDYGNDGDRITLPERQGTSDDEKALLNFEIGGEGGITIDYFEEVVGEERLGLMGGRKFKW